VKDGDDEVPLYVKRVAEWLNLSDDHVRAIERGREELTFENADVLMRQTGISTKWLLAKHVERPVNWCGKPYSQKDYDQQQKVLDNPGFSACEAHDELKQAIKFIAEILLQAAERDETQLYGSKLRNALWKIYSTFPKNGNHVSLYNFIDLKFTPLTLTAQDFEPLLKEWQRRVERVAFKKQKKQAAKA
jgi:hypothetical protein